MHTSLSCGVKSLALLLIPLLLRIEFEEHLATCVGYVHGQFVTLFDAGQEIS
jgi:hypothetical protein